MKYKLILLLIIAFFLPPSITASGLIVTNDQSQVVPAESRGLIYFDGKTETLITSVSFNFNALTMWNFGWLIAVPNKPKVELLNSDIFIDLDKLLEKRTNQTPFQSATTVTRPAYLMQYNVFDLKNLQPMSNWLNQQGYIIPKNAFSLLSQYQKKGWYMIIVEVDGVHLENTATDSLIISAAHTIPVKITFKADKIYYPLGLTTIQPDSDSQSVPYAFSYGQSSNQVLGEQDSKVDNILKSQSPRKYPAIPLDISYLKTDLFVFDSSGVSGDGFVVDYATSINTKQIPFLKIPDDTIFLTHLTNFTPMLQLKDIKLKRTTTKKRVNAKSSWCFFCR